MRQQLLGNLEKIQTELIDETHAEWTLNPSNPMQLTKFADGWKVDFTSPEYKEYLEMSAQAFEDTAKMFNEVRQGIVDEKIASRDEARKELARLKDKYQL